jgi:hypothetical protein
MIFEVNDNVRIWSEFNPLAESLIRYTSEVPGNLFRVNREKVSIRGRWFDVLTPSEVVRQRNEQDGFYRVIYIQINMDTGEYYIGKANRPTWSQLQRYQGSGVKFRAKFSRNTEAYVRYTLPYAKLLPKQRNSKLQLWIKNCWLMTSVSTSWLVGPV